MSSLVVQLDAGSNPEGGKHYSFLDANFILILHSRGVGMGGGGGGGGAVE